MSKKDTLFLELVSLGLGHATYTSFKRANWHAIKTLAEQQELYAVLLDGIERLPQYSRPPQELLLEWIGEVLQGYEYRYEQYCKAISELVSFYNCHGLKMMVLKGYACCLDWPKPNHRPCGDIDIWLFGKQKEADALLAKEKGIKIDSSHHHHTVFEWDGFTVENHYDFVNVHARRSSADVERTFKELGMDDSNHVSISGEKVYLPTANLHALFLLKHAASHFVGSNINLRQVLDWAFFVVKHTDEIDWKWLNGEIAKYHMSDFVNSLNAICVEDLGFESSIFHGIQFNPQLKDKVLEDILNPEYATEEPAWLISRLVYKYRRWKGNGWKQGLCFNESRWDTFWTGLWAKIMKPASI